MLKCKQNFTIVFDSHMLKRCIMYGISLVIQFDSAKDWLFTLQFSVQKSRHHLKKKKKKRKKKKLNDKELQL